MKLKFCYLLQPFVLSCSRHVFAKLSAMLPDGFKPVILELTKIYYKKSFIVNYYVKKKDYL